MSSQGSLNQLWKKLVKETCPTYAVFDNYENDKSDETHSNENIVGTENLPNEKDDQPGEIQDLVFKEYKFTNHIQVMIFLQI